MIDAFAAVITGGGRGALSAIRLWGSNCGDVVDALFQPHVGKSLSTNALGRLRVGTLGKVGGDEVVGVKIGENPLVFEFQGHAGPAVLNRSLDALRAEGVQIVEDEDWLHFEGGASLETQALIDLKSAQTLAVSERLIDQAQGALSEALRRIRTPADVAELIALGEFGCRMSTGWTLALAGRPNVGKSSLFNALLGFQRAIVNPTVGTTRDQIRARTAIGGWPVELIDMAGIRQSDDPIEREGVERAEAAVTKSDVTLLILDGSSPLQSEDQGLLGRVSNAIRVANKSDLAPAWNVAGEACLKVSAKNGEGLADLLDEIKRGIVPDEPAAAAAIPFRRAQLARLRQLKQILERGEPVPNDLPLWVARDEGSR
jgi:tRNA modification GTPase